MVERTRPADPAWSAVDAYLAEQLLGEDAALSGALAANARAGLPDIDVSPPQGKMLHLLARMVDARRILEIGTLGGYSTIWLARALAPGGGMVSLEIDPHHAATARGNIERAGLGDCVEIRVGAATATLAAMEAAGEGPFDLVFIDADKENNVNYLRAALAMARAGTAIIVDNVVREGAIIDPDSTDPRVQAARDLFAAVRAEPRLSATVIQTVGSKKWDGFLLALVQ